MKLTCVLCGGALQFKGESQTAVCQNCGLEYSLDTLRQRLDANNSLSPEMISQPDKPTPRPVEPIPQPIKPDSPCDCADEEPIFDAACEPVNGADEEPIFDAACEPVNGADEEPIFDAACEPVNGADEEPIFDAACEPISGADEEPTFDAACEPIGGGASDGPALSRDTVLNIWREYLPQAMPQYGFGMKMIYGKMKGCYFAPYIPADCAQRASRYLTKGKVAPKDILGHYSFKPQGGLAGIVVAQDRMFLPVGKLGIEYLEIIYADLLRADVKNEASHKIRTEVKLLTYSNEFTLFYKDGRVKTYTANAQYNAAAIVQALNQLTC